MAKLTAAAVKAAKSPGRYSDGDGLYLLVAKGGTKSWMIRVQKDGTRRDIGLGSASRKGLADARRDAALLRSQIDAGIDPVAARSRDHNIPTFQAAAERVHAEQLAGWRNGKHTQQWLRTLEIYAFPFIGSMSVADVDLAHVRDLLATIWLEKPETARRVFQRIRTVLDWAVSKQYRSAELPTRAVTRGLPRQTRRVKHIPAMPYAEVPDFMAALLGQPAGVVRLALEALVLTAVRSKSLRLATWDQVDLYAGIWTVPDENMKGGLVHMVPLSPAAAAVFRCAEKHRRGDSDFVFPGQRRGRPLSENTLAKRLDGMGIEWRPHGFRSSFRDWTAEKTSFAPEVAEMALAHVIANKVEAAYRRGNLFEKRRELMDAWSAFALSKAMGA